MSDTLFGKVAAILDEKTVVINKGSGDGVKSEDKFHIYNELGPFQDPESGESLGTTKRILGEVVVDTVEEKFCIASTPTRYSPLPTLMSGALSNIQAQKERSSLPIKEGDKRENPNSTQVEVGSLVYKVKGSDREDESVNSSEDVEGDSSDDGGEGG